MAKCEKCGFDGEFVIEEYGQSKLIICPDCYSFSYIYCEHKQSGLVKYLLNNTYRVRNICIDCHTLHGNFIKQAGLNINEIRTIDKTKYDQWVSDQSDKYQSRFSYLYQANQEREKKEWFDKHNEYLNSMEWKEKRDEVLSRDGYLCQACLKKRATQVHHTSYKHWKNEPLYELVSVCDECHEAITEMDRINNDLKINPYEKPL